MKNIFVAIVLINATMLGQTLNKNFLVEKNIVGGAKKIGQYNFVNYSVKANNGKELYQIVDKVDYDIPYAKLEVFKN